MPKLSDFLPQPPWEGPPVPKIAMQKREYGPPKTAAPEVKEIWRNALKETEVKYPIGHPLLVAEAKRAGKSQVEMQMVIAQETYLDRRRTLLETWAGEYDEVEKFEEEDKED